MIIARRWLRTKGIQVDSHYTFNLANNRPSHPDLFDHTNLVAYEVKTGVHYLSERALAQILDYEYAVRTCQAGSVVYLFVAFEGRMGLGLRFREALRERGFKILFLS